MMNTAGVWSVHLTHWTCLKLKGEMLGIRESHTPDQPLNPIVSPLSG